MIDENIRKGAEAYTLEDLLTGDRYEWCGERNYVRLHPDQVGHVFRVIDSLPF